MHRLRFALLAVFAVVGCGPAAKKSSEKIDDRNTTYRPEGSTLGNAARKGKQGAQRLQFEQLRTLIVALELAENRMPTAEAIKADLKANPDARDLLKLIADGVIILTGTADRQGMWAYEIDADKAGGIVIAGGNVTDATADDVKKYLGQK